MHAHPVLLTPGPLTTSDRVKRAMLRDWGSRDPEFEAITRFVLAELLRIANAGKDYVAVPLQGSGTFAVEAMIGTMVPRTGRMLVLSNGSYGQRMVAIAERSGIDVATYAVGETDIHDLVEIKRLLETDATIHTVAVVHCETTSGLRNPIEQIADVVNAGGRKLLIDSMSGFGALPVDAGLLRFAALCASANKCLQGVPGISFVICRRDLLAEAAGRGGSVVLDLEAQSRQIELDGQWRFTPPTHIVAALAEALRELSDEGGTLARLARYTANCQRLIDGMAALGFAPALLPQRQAPIIVSFAEPKEDWYSFPAFYDALKERGFAIYAGKMKVGGTFRVGTIGAIDPDTIDRFVKAAVDTVAMMRQ